MGSSAVSSLIVVAPFVAPFIWHFREHGRLGSNQHLLFLHAYRRHWRRRRLRTALRWFCRAAASTRKLARSKCGFSTACGSDRARVRNSSTVIDLSSSIRTNSIQERPAFDEGDDPFGIFPLKRWAAPTATKHPAIRAYIVGAVDNDQAFFCEIILRAKALSASATGRASP